MCYSKSLRTNGKTDWDQHANTIYEKKFWKAFDKECKNKCFIKPDKARFPVPKLFLSQKRCSKTFQKMEIYKNMGTKLGKEAGARWVMLYGECTDVCRHKAEHANRCYYCKKYYYRCMVCDCSCYEEGRSYYENYESSSDSDSDSDLDYDSDPDYEGC